ncbi:class I SAM-dependent methyltransferase [Brucella sp. NBRC 12950]|uniref:class I SAM-dependent methyltransferase n=1 Tax=Brucella sp. NBRC 12950 TaxID=2994518 RepID=UPI00249FF075|nr:class I SAM-dependent methyltransferase [Brucella sp. NBRC 12950]GLU27578.1 hypothetical protein Brsp01_28110 [Brucella sp. NBRC 12950]
MVSPKTIEQWRQAPRLNTFACFFNNTATGIAGAPGLMKPSPDKGLLQYDIDSLVFWDSHRQLWGHFDSHYFASIPFRVEEECRLGSAILAYALEAWARTRRGATVYTLGAGEGTFARTLAKLGDGRLNTLCCSPTAGNRESFYANRGSSNAHFYYGPFFDLTEESYWSNVDLHPFRDGFDVLLEDTTFQMYGADRDNQLAFVVPRIRENGLFIQIQKLSHSKREEYDRREHQKDEEFKSRFFTRTQIASKKSEILKTMSNYEVGLEETIAALRQNFRFSVVTWNSGNFYTIVSSNSERSLKDFVNGMIRPAIPAEFSYEQLPFTLLNNAETGPNVDWSWRPARSVGEEIAEGPVSSQRFQSR